MGVVFFLNKLHSHVTAAAYEGWVRNVDYPTAATIPSIVEYRVARLEGLLEGTPRAVAGQVSPSERIRFG